MSEARSSQLENERILNSRKILVNFLFSIDRQAENAPISVNCSISANFHLDSISIFIVCRTKTSIIINSRDAIIFNEFAVMSIANKNGEYVTRET